jgi:multidrug efflux pump subunit AcrA (membrane-fusion protein)
MRLMPAGQFVIQAPLVAVVVASLAGCGLRPEPRPMRPAPTVTIVAARKTNVPILVNRQGTTRALEEVTLRARVKGFLGKPLFAEGDNVKAEQLLVVIEEKPYQIQLDLAKAKLEEAQAELVQAQQSKAREIAEAQLHLDEAQRTLDQVEERRERSLLARNAATIDDVDRRVATLKKSSAQVEADLAKLEQTRADYETNILAAKAKVNAAAADVQDAETNLGYCKMYAPINGKIGQMLVKTGNLVGPDQNTDLATIRQLDPMGVDLFPPARYLPLLTRLMRSGLSMNLFIEGQRPHSDQAKAYFIDNSVEPTTGTVLMKATVANPDESLLPGQYVKVKINIGEYRDMIIIPEKAVIEGQGGPTVYFVDPKGGDKVGVARVDPIDSYRGMRVIRSGLESGQRVIVEGIQLVRPGQAVKVEEVALDSFFREETDTDVDDRYDNVAIPSEPTSGAVPGDGRPKAAVERAAPPPR